MRQIKKSTRRTLCLMKRRKMTALQRKYFGKHRRHRVRAVGRVVHSKRRRYHMARYRRHFSRSRIGGGMKSMLSPVLGGFADHYLNSMLPISGVGSTAVGIFMHSPVVKDIGLYQIGHSLGNIIPIPGFGGGSVGGLL